MACNPLNMVPNVPTPDSTECGCEEFIRELLEDYYNKEEIDTILSGYITNEDLVIALSNYYTKTQVDALINAINMTLEQHNNSIEILQDDLVSVLNSLINIRNEIDDTNDRIDNLTYVESVTGDGVDNTDPQNPVITMNSGSVESVTGNVVDNTDPANPVVTAIATVTGTAVDNTDPLNPVINAGEFDGIATVTGNLVNNTDPENPIVNGVATVTGTAVDNTDPFNPIINAGEFDGIASVTGNVVDNTDPSNPIITAVKTVTGDVVNNTDPQNPVVNASSLIDQRLQDFYTIDEIDSKLNIYVTRPVLMQELNKYYTKLETDQLIQQVQVSIGVQQQMISDINDEIDDINEILDNLEPGVESVTGNIVDNTDPLNPVINSIITGSDVVSTTTSGLVSYKIDNFRTYYSTQTMPSIDVFDQAGTVIGNATFSNTNCLRVGSACTFTSTFYVVNNPSFPDTIYLEAVIMSGTLNATLGKINLPDALSGSKNLPTYYTSPFSNFRIFKRDDMTDLGEKNFTTTITFTPDNGLTIYLRAYNVETFVSDGSPVNVWIAVPKNGRSTNFSINYLAGYTLDGTAYPLNNIS
jgi:hypothetical protein